MPRVPGTPAYMAPQMFTAHYSIEGDMWSFGVLLAEMLNGGIVSNTITPIQQRTFLQKQKRVLLPPDNNEVSRLCAEIGETTVAHCLSIRKASLEAVRHLTHYPYAPPPQTAADFMCNIAQLCFSILERNRAPFTVIVKLLFCCSTVVASHSSTGTEHVTDDQVNDCISQWLSSLIPAVQLEGISQVPEPNLHLRACVGPEVFTQAEADRRARAELAQKLASIFS
ncbi:hypothetical protein Pelo_16704 [Pelomyxa schiedti]|nr:hypothetical protein Pelo_16704 [Pelomyxa schiedti]